MASPVTEPARPGIRRLTLIAAAIFLSVVSAIDPSGQYPRAPQGPGLTLDEAINVQQGAYLFEAVRGYGLALLHPDSLREVFDDPAFLPDHPPLGRLALGVTHHTVRAVAPPVGEAPVLVAPARVASAWMFALTAFLLGWYAWKWYGPVAGTVAPLAIALMPRVYGHAHLAALETAIGLSYALAALVLADRWSGEEPPTRRAAVTAGLCCGLALLTKMQAVFLFPPAIVLSVIFWKLRAVKPLLMLLATAGVVFLAGWPWLWLDPVGRGLQYLGGATDRLTIYVWYFGEKLADRDVPWHYPWVLSLVTVPVGLLALAAVGIGARVRGGADRRDVWLLAMLLFPLLMFSLPGVPVYDGARLFLIVFPLLALWIGRGAAVLTAWLEERRGAVFARCVLIGLLLLQTAGHLQMHPCYLSYYNLLVGGIRGATALGLEPTYWGDSLTRELLSKTARTVPAGSELAISPVPHQFVLRDLAQQSPVLQERGIRLVPFAPNVAAPPEWLLMHRRQADLPPWLEGGFPATAGADPVSEVVRGGGRLSGLYRWRELPGPVP